MPTPTWEVVLENPLEEFPQAQSEGVSHSAVERMADAVKKTMGTQQEHPLAQETTMIEAVFLDDVAALAS